MRHHQFVVDELLSLYDHERQAASATGYRREALPDLVRLIDLHGTSSTIVYSAIDSATADPTIEREMAYFMALGHELEWKTFAHDQPADLVERLRRRGFSVDDSEAIVVLDVETADQRLFEPTSAVRRVREPDELRIVLAAVRDGRPNRGEELARELLAVPDQLSVYVAELDGQPAACGWARFEPRSKFASLWGGTTRTDLRNRGLYSQLVGARVQEARQRGYRYVTVDALPTSRPILERRGFRVLTWSTPCVFRPSS